MAKYHYTECGLDDAFLVNGFDLIESDYGPAVSVRNAQDLHLTIAGHIVSSTSDITGPQFRFLRIQMDLSQRELGELCGLTDQAVAKWEKGAPTEMAQTMIRFLFTSWRDGRVDAFSLAKEWRVLDQIEAPEETDYVETEEGWSVAA